MAQSLRVLYSFPHVLDRPGIAYTALNQVLGLARLGLSIELFCAATQNIRLPDNVHVHETLTLAGRRLPHRAVGVQRAYNFHDFRVAKWFERHCDEVDIAHVWPQGCLQTLAVGRKYGLTMLRESPNPHTASVMRDSARAITDSGIALPTSHSHAFDARRLAREKAEYESATAVLVPSDYARQEFIAQGFPAGRLLQHRYGCDLTRFPERAEPRVGGPLRAVFLGRGDPTKGLHIALQAWREAALPGATLKIAGKLQPAYAASLKEECQLPGVSVEGFVDDVPALLSSADVMLLPTWTEGSALVTLEAQASGCVPMISAAAGPLGVDGMDFVEHPVGDASVLAEQLVRFAEQPQDLARMSRRGTDRRSYLSWDSAAEALADCYGMALKS